MKVMVKVFCYEKDFVYNKLTRCDADTCYGVWKWIDVNEVSNLKQFKKHSYKMGFLHPISRNIWMISFNDSIKNPYIYVSVEDVDLVISCMNGFNLNDNYYTRNEYNTPYENMLINKYMNTRISIINE